MKGGRSSDLRFNLLLVQTVIRLTSLPRMISVAFVYSLCRISETMPAFVVREGRRIWCSPAETQASKRVFKSGSTVTSSEYT